MTKANAGFRVMKPLTDWQLAYLAGFIDGEGSIGIYGANRRNNSAVRLMVNNTYLEVVDFIHALTGVGTVIYKEGGKRKAPSKIWQVTSVFEMRDVIVKLLPYLIVKKNQAMSALEFCDGKLCGNPLHDDLYYHEKTKMLNKYDRG